MKTSAFLLSAAVLCTSVNLFAQQAPATSETTPAERANAPAATNTATTPPVTTVVAPERRVERKPYSLDLAFGAQAVRFDDKATQDAVLYGATLSLNGYLSKTRPVLRNMLLTADAGIFFGDYTDTMFHQTAPYAPSPSLIERQVISRKNTQYNVPVHLTLAYELPLKDFRFRIGPTVGFTFVSFDSKFHTYNDLSNPTDPSDPNSNGRQNSSFIKKSSSQAVFSYGGTAGATWNVTDRVRLDLQYRITANGALDFGYDRNFGKSLSQQVTLGLGWRF